MGYRINMALPRIWQALKTYCVLLILLAGVSCVNTKKAVYFSDQKNGSFAAPVVPKLVIQPNDLLSISVSSLNPEASAVFNQANNNNAPGGAGTSTTTTTAATGFLVDGNGNIQFPFLGQVKAAGLTKEELKDHLTKTLLDKKLLVDPIITVRFLNFKVTVLGEVAHPTVVTVPSERISLLEAIGLAGDLTIYAKRDNVLVIRDEDGQKVTHRLNLNSTELFKSPYFYLKSNDVVYVEPNKSKVASTGRAQLWLPIVFSALSLGVIVVDRLTR
ncbi:polysaccharide biosynthesis/export family protein [Longitalea luteola]|uniref:polysaccharide biosynthesis/export family protein n=1 Tax=Longitalea luteola TaxID=2812563 RepID=UPI001A9613D3|nr:polysaccharide biosynthesis/export family protein [Longitalea luteola]